MLSGAMQYMKYIVIKKLIVSIHRWVTFKGHKADAVQYTPFMHGATTAT